MTDVNRRCRPKPQEQLFMLNPLSLLATSRFITTTTNFVCQMQENGTESGYNTRLNQI